LEQSMKFFRELALDCHENSYSNSHRDDLFMEPGYISYDGSVKTLSSRETFSDGSSRRVNELDSERAGKRVKDPSGFLRDYWMGRYYGFIKAPETNDPKLTKVEPRTGQKFGAEPYTGPARPEVY